MRSITTAAIGLAFLAAACGGSSVSPGATCGAGTMLVDGQCVVVGSGGLGGAVTNGDAAGGASGGGGKARTAAAGGVAAVVDAARHPRSGPNTRSAPRSLHY